MSSSTSPTAPASAPVSSNQQTPAAAPSTSADLAPGSDVKEGAEGGGQHAHHAHPQDHSQAQPPSHIDSTTTGYAPNENQLAGLVEAANAAAGQDVSEWAAAAAVAAAAAGSQHQLDGYAGDIHIEDDGFGDTGGFTRQITATAMRSPKKRKRGGGGGEDNLDPALSAASAGFGDGGEGSNGASGGNGKQQAQQQQQQQQRRQQQQTASGRHESQGHDENNSLNGHRSLPVQPVPDLLAAGVHSAAALFRQPSTNKKHTRPPMSKLFSSLELSPENFLHLQAAAKAYMLDDDHPERRDCVGQRGKGDSEMVKLRLFNCVRDFLIEDNRGERFFGESSFNEGIGRRTHVWPRDQPKIVLLVIPLLRRMVTNERQRQYAVETRKGGGPDDRKRRKPDDESEKLSPPQNYSTEEQLQLHENSHDSHGHVPYDLAAPPLPPPPASAIQVPVDVTSWSGMQLGLTNLFVDGYRTDWETVTKMYERYNKNYDLDNLWSISGLQQPDWWGLVAAIDSHYQIVHNGGAICPSACEKQSLDGILGSETLQNLPWRIGGTDAHGYQQSPRSEFASSIIREISRVIRTSLAGSGNEENQNGTTAALSSTEGATGS